VFEVGATMADGDKVGLRHMMPGLFSGIATALTAAAGLVGVLHETGYIGNRQAPTPQIVANASAQSATPAGIGQMARSDSPAAAGELPRQPRARNLSGGWRDGGLNCHQIKQVGHELTVTSYFADNGRLWAVGSGTLRGGVVSLKLNSANPASPEANLIVSDDGRELSGMMKGAKGAHVARWRFVGPSCVQTASRPE